MSKENQTITNKELVCNFLNSVYHTEPKRITDAALFFNNACIEVLDHQLFENQDYREQWQNNLNVLNHFCHVLKQHDPKIIEQALEEVAAKLGKEINHV